MAYARTASVSAMLRNAREPLTKILRGAARTGAKVIAEEAKDRAGAQEVKEAIVTRLRNRDDGRIVVVITVEDPWARSLGIWAEYGTDPHVISVQYKTTSGELVDRPGQKRMLANQATGQFFGRTVRHPGAQAHPFLRPALDAKEGEAIAAAQRYINAHIGKAGFKPAAGEGEDA